ncbi:MAG: VWA domain-containing protein, partial [Chloroflexi bacterium]|nr:VWA domain-containing protein [Chloroflexota bacterium]
MLSQNHVSRSPIAASAVEFVAKISITAETDVAANRRLPLNIGLVIDRSGSMENAPIEYAKAAAIQVIEKLHEHDYCTVVIFDTEIDVLADGETMNEVNKRRLIHRIQHVYARGGTDLHAGWHTCVNRQLRINNRELVGRVFLLSDGHANTGLTDVTQLGAQAAAFHRQGISTSTFGIGDGYNEVIMGALASNGEGNTHYISEVQHIEECFRQELAALFTAALRDTQLHITVPTGYSVQIVGERPHTLRDREMTIHFGTIMRAEQRNIYLHIKADTPPAAGSVTMPVRATGLDAQG